MLTIIHSPAPKTLRAMTNHAPHAYGLALGVKREEYRYRATKYRGWVFFHSGLSTASDDAFEYLDMSPKDAKRGYIIGAGYLSDCTKNGIYFAYLFTDPVLFENPLRVRGKQSILWLPADDKEKRIFENAWHFLQRMIHIPD